MELFNGFILNILSIIFWGSIGIFFSFRFPKNLTPWLWGILFGGITIFTMGNKIITGNGGVLDFHHLVMTLAGFVGGIYPAVIAAVISGGYCLVQGRAGALGGALAVFIFGFIGCWLRKRDFCLGKTGRHFPWLAIGLLLGIISLVIISLTPPWDSGSLKIAPKALFPLLLFSPIATLIIFKVFLFIQNLFQKVSIFDAFFNNPLIQLIIFDYQGNVIQVSNSFSRDRNLSKYTNQIFSLLPDQVVEKIRCHSNIAENQHISFEINVGNGQIMEGILYKLVPWKDRPIFFMVLLNITEVKNAAKANQQLTTLVENSDDAIFTVSPAGIITSWNKGAAKIYGYTAAEIIGRDYTMLVPPDLPADMMERVEAIKRGENWNLLFVDTPINGNRINIFINVSVLKDLRGEILEYFVIGQDISEHIKYENALSSERELLMVTLNSLMEGVIATGPDGRIILINDVAAKLTGYLSDECLGKHLHEVLYIIDDKTSEPLDITVSQNVLRNPVLVTRDLREIPVAIRSSAIEFSGEQLQGTVIIFQDITEKQKTERELLKAEKLESLGILAGGIAHDFNNILAAILSNTQLAIVKHQKNQDIKKYLMDTVEVTRKASELTKQLLTFSKGGTPVKKDASLRELIRDTAGFVLRGANTKAEFVIPDDLWGASIDEGQISQVIQNLVLNANQAMIKGGIIKISAENVTIKAHSYISPGQYVKITVRDHGVGIPKENLSKIFDPFFTTKKDGNGLGLATSYSIIKQHNGYIDVESGEETGTAFFVYLPAIQKTLEISNKTNEVAPTNDSLKILLMDDEAHILNAVGEMLECYGHRVCLTMDGSEAIAIYQQALIEEDPFDVVIMDLTIPGGLGGQEAIAILRDIDPEINAIVSSGYANNPILADYERFGFKGVVTKPYKFDELNEVLHRVSEQKRL